MLCGVKVNKDRIMARPGWSGLTAVHQGHVYEIKSTYILQPGPAALTEGIRQIHFVLAHVVMSSGLRWIPGSDPAKGWMPHWFLRDEGHG